MGEPEVADIRAVERRAVARAQLNDSGIGAVVAQSLADGALSVRISDGERFGWLLVNVAASGASAEDIEAAIERRAADLPEADRLDALEALSPLTHNA